MGQFARMVFFRTLHSKAHRMIFSFGRILAITGTWLILCSMLLVSLTCSPPRQFSTELLYSSKRFTGADLSGQTIMVSPLFTPAGPIVDGQLNSGVEIPVINRNRPSLRLLPRELFEDRLIASMGTATLDSFYRMLYKGEMVAVQNSGEIWQQVRSDYLMVLKLTHGLKIRTTREQTTRRIRLEGELWDCDSMEVVWRASVDGRGLGEHDTDRQLLLNAICRVFEALPKVFPGYGKGKW